MGLLIDTASSARRLAPEEFKRWASERTVFLSSEMRELHAVRATVASALRGAGFAVVAFEELGGRDEDAERAYLDGVARSDIYVGVVADRYGTMLPSGRSPTHEEYLAARSLGKRISFWLQADGSTRQGNAADFAGEVRAFHTTGQFVDGDDLAARLVERLSEMAADDEAPWVKVGDVCMRASRLQDRGSVVTIAADVRDAGIVDALETLRAERHRPSSGVPITTVRRTGMARVTEVATETRSASLHVVEITADVDWAGTRSGAFMSAATFNGVTPEQQTEIALRAGLLGEPIPSPFDGRSGGALPSIDPFGAIAGQALSPSTEQAVVRLLLVEALIGGNLASRIGRFGLGPERRGEQRVELEWTAPRVYENLEPETRSIDGVRRTA